jgi:hypothetical protein
MAVPIILIASMFHGIYQKNNQEIFISKAYCNQYIGTVYQRKAVN